MNNGQDVNRIDLLPVRMLNEFTYCPRLFYYEYIQGEFQESSDILEGVFVHRNVDVEKGELPRPGKYNYDNLSVKSVLLSSYKYGIISKMDIIEVTGNEFFPVEFKKGNEPRLGKVWHNDSIQLCAQGLILEDNGYKSKEGYIYYKGSNERVKVEFSEELIADTVEKISEAKKLLISNRIPDPLIDSNKCDGCSLLSICLPDETALLIDHHSDEPRELRKYYSINGDSSPLYIQEQGATVSKKNEELIITKNQNILASIKLIDISSLSLFGNIQVTTQALREMINRNIPVAYFSSGGWFYGITSGMGSKNVELRINQYKTNLSPGESLKVARLFIYGKIRNSRTMLRRNSKINSSAALKRLSDLSKDSLSSESIEELMGIEGSAARVYFQHFNDMIRNSNFSDKFKLNERNRRPPKDPVNALLSFNYALLTKDAFMSLLKIGFDPYLGFLHSHKYGKPALALDLIEEFRSIVADSVVINLINTGEIDGSYFLKNGDSVALNGNGRKKVINAYERRMNVVVTHPIFEYSINYRKVLEMQGRLLSKWVMGEIKDYPVFTVR
jgi:CRISPR-associated protein Cas1